MQYIDALRRGGAPNKARTQLRQFLLANPTSAEAHLQLAVLQSEGRGQISRAASENAQKALHLGLSNPPGIALAHQLLGRYYLDRGEGEKAADNLNQAIAALSSHSTVGEPLPSDHGFLAYLYHLRSQAYRRQRQYELAYEDGQQAITQAQAAGNDKSAAFYRSELEVIEKHAGRTLGASPPRVP
jgi:tetratricopeptide (TPR) repeat protein